MRDLRVGLVGYGMAGRDIHAPLLREVDGLQVTHVVTGNAERAAAARLDDPEVRVVASTEDLWAYADSLDLVVLASPTGVHAEQARDALRRDVARRRRQAVRDATRTTPASWWRSPPSAACCSRSSRTGDGTPTT